MTVQKKPKSPKDNGQLSDMLTLEGSGRRRNDTRPALRVSLKTLGIPVQTSYVEVSGIKLERTRARNFFFADGQGNQSKTRPKTPYTPLWHTYSEPSRHEDSSGSIQNMPYL